MNCPNCGSETQPGQKFCAACGMRLAVGCANCGAALPEGAAFCPACGTPVAGVTEAPGGSGRRSVADASNRSAGPSGAGQAPVAERRVVSVLFCDLVGFTTASQARDSEDTREFLWRYYELCRERVERYGGTIEKFVGDAVMAVWGVPTAHEDDAERAVRAALELVAQVPAVLADAQARAAVMTGEAAVTLGAQGQGMVAGDLVNTAARLQSVAEPGSVLVGELTFRAAERGIAFEALGERQLRGKDLPVPAWRAQRVVAGRGGRLSQDELEPPFVGRALEQRLLDELFRASRAESRLRLVSVTGQAGIGKSRLAREFEKQMDGLVELVYWHQGRCPAYGEGVTFWALAEMVRRRCGIAEGEGAPTAAVKLRETLEKFVPDTDERERIANALRALLGMEAVGPGPTETGELFVLWRTFFERVAGSDSAVMVFEDLQWADEGLIAFIQHLLEWSRSSPILVVTLARPELLDARPTWGAGMRNFTSLHLEPLSDEAMGELLQGMIPGLPGTARTRIVQRAEGVPLYAVETVRMLMADGTLERTDGNFRLTRPVSAPQVPETLRGLIAARLDALEPAERVLLQNASVLGQSFTLEALSSVTGESPAALESRLSGLVRREFLRLDRDPLSPGRGQYQFMQELVREVAYATLARRDRQLRHLAAARHFEGLGDESLAGVLADHYLAAWRTAPEGPEREALAAQARVALRAAADRALRLFAFRQAAAFLERSLEVTEGEPEQAELHERIGDALTDGFAEGVPAREHYQTAIDWLRRQADGTGVARVTARLGTSLLNELQVKSARAVLEPAWLEAGEHIDDPASIMLAGQLARAWMLDGDHRAVPLADRVIEAADRSGRDSELVEAIITRGTARQADGWIDGQATLYGAIEMARRFGLPSAEIRAMNNLGTGLQETDPLALRPVVADAIELCRRTGRDVEGWYPTLAYLHVQEGRLAEALGLLDDADTVLTSAGLLAESRWVRSRILVLIGDVEAHQTLRASRPDVGSELLSGEVVANELAEEMLIAVIEGRPEFALTKRDAVESDPWFAKRAALAYGLAALAMRDERAAEAAVAALAPAARRITPVRRAFRQTMQAGLAALRGRHPEALAVLREASSAWAGTGELVEGSVARVVIASLLGRGVPEAVEIERELRERWSAIGAPGFVAFIDREMAREPVQSVAQPASPGRVKAPTPA